MLKTAYGLVIVFIGIFSSSLVLASTPIQGEMQNNIYTNNTLGFTLKFPENWVASPVMTANSEPATQQTLVELLSNNSALLFEIGSSAEKVAISAQAYDLSKLVAQPLNDQQILDQVKQAMLQTTKTKAADFSSVYTTKLGEVNFSAMNIKLQIGNNTVYETAYAKIRNNYLLFFVTAATNTQKSQGIFQDVFNTLLFY